MPDNTLKSGFEGDKLLSLEDLAREAQASHGALWEKAHECIVTYPDCLKQKQHGSRTFLVTPYNRDTRPPYAVAVLKDGKEMTGEATLYIAPEGDFSKALSIYQSVMPGDPQGSLRRLDYDEGERGVSAAEFVPVLNGILTLVQQEKTAAENRKLAQRQLWKGRLNKAGEIAFKCIVALFYIALIAGAIWGVGYKWIYQASQANVHYMEQWDNENPDVVIRGVQIDIGEELKLPSGFDRMDPGIPRVRELDPSRPRAFTVNTGTCDTDSDPVKVGKIQGDYHLVAQTDAPAGVVRVRVREDAGVDICALDPVDRDTRLTYVVVLQQRPNEQ